MKYFRAIALLSLIAILYTGLLSGCPVRPGININGTWNRGTRASIKIKGKRGLVKGKNGAVIPVKIFYQKDGAILIKEFGHTPEYLANYIPLRIARYVYSNALVTDTYYIIKEDTNGNIVAEIHAWEVLYDHDYHPYYVIPGNFTEVWGTN